MQSNPPHVRWQQTRTQSCTNGQCNSSQSIVLNTACEQLTARICYTNVWARTCVRACASLICDTSPLTSNLLPLNHVRWLIFEWCRVRPPSLRHSVAFPDPHWYIFRQYLELRKGHFLSTHFRPLLSQPNSSLCYWHCLLLDCLETRNCRLKFLNDKSNMNKEVTYRRKLRCTNIYQTRNVGRYLNIVKCKWLHKTKENI